MADGFLTSTTGGGAEVAARFMTAACRIEVDCARLGKALLELGRTVKAVALDATRHRPLTPRAKLWVPPALVASAKYHPRSA